MNKKKALLLFLAAVVSFTIGYGAVAKAWPTPYWRGYFYNALDTNGLEVLPPWGGPGGCQGNGWALPSWVDTPNEFTNFIVCKLGGNNQNHIGAAFIISTMSGMKNANPGGAEINEFVNRVNYAASQGWINFYDNTGCVLPNTYYQDGPGDVATYGGCASGPSNSVTFYNGAGDYYIIKRFCANPLGNMPALHDDQNFNMSGRTTVTNQTNAARGANPFPGDQLIFHHYVRNNGPTATSPTNIWAVAERMEPLPVATVAGAGNFGPFGIGEVNVYNTTVNIPAGTVPGTRYCQRVGYDPINPFGGTNGRGATVCATVAYNFTLTPSINIQINGVAGPVAGNVAEPGDTINFTYAVNNTGTTVSQTVTCTYRQATYAGYNQTQPVTAFTPGGANCAPTRTFPYGANTTVATEAGVPASAVNTSICRSLSVTPSTASGGTALTNPPVCVFVAAKPYARVYGGDVSAGGGLVTSPSSPTSCAQSAGAAVIGWNRRAGGAYAGAGVQFAAYAMSTIFDTASALGNGGGAATPIGLSFGNTSTNVANGSYGGSFGTTPCIADYYSRRPGAPLSPPTGPNAITNMVTGVYGSATNEYYSGTADISAGERIIVYVNGDAYINANVRYVGTPWNSANIPSFQLIARGNIYIDRGVTQLDGLYVAQASGASGGIIYTCAETATLYVPLPLVGQLGSRCNTKLTVNGGFVGRQVQLIRTNGTLRQSNAAEASTSGTIAEAFNYNPSLWIPQPAALPGAADYDAINSLPPIL